MAEIVRRIGSGYRFIFEDLTDPRTRDWFLVAKPYQGLLLLGIYLMFIYKWGPRWMKNRPAFNLYWVLIVYNLLQIALCANLFISSQRFWGWGGSFKWICEPVDFSESQEALDVAHVVYNYYILKILDLLDTVFFVLRKKSEQVSFLHVYHHTGMVMLIWGAITYYPGGHGTLVGVINSFVHTVMYTYYLFTIAMPSIKNVLWIKKFVTQLQIIQFLVFVVHFMIIVVKPDCEYPRWSAALFLPQNFFMLILFTDFYIKTYAKKPKHKESKGEATMNGKKYEKHNEKTFQNGINGKKIGDDRIEFLLGNHHNASELSRRTTKRT